MFHPFFENNVKIRQYVVVWIMFALLQAISVISIIPLPVGILIADAFVHAILYGVLGVLLWSVMKYGNFSSLSLYQRIINYTALAILTIVLSLGIGYGFEYILGDEIANSFTAFLPVRALITLLLYTLIIQYFRLFLREEEAIADDLDDQEQNLLLPEAGNEIIQEVALIERVAVKSGQKIHVIMVPDIIYLQADGDYVHIFTMTGKYLKEQTMKYFNEHLPVGRFVRVHRSFIVNIEAISRIELYEKQNQLLILKNGFQLKISASGYKALRLALNL
ncbi:MAG: LytTR family transcriptional regulator DNA-binding domain-containing protein [Bacteroidales bacterium]|nr:LytTR family transcriptional regulator DNA-binding domain-containing protein [Bacteroidales bacterium]